MPVGALYLHMPFCVRRCRYCDFPTAAIARGDALVARYTESLEALVERAAVCGLLGAVSTAYVGGGTPTMAGEGLAGLVSSVRRSCPSVAELTCEANPESLAPELAAQIAGAGATRVSMGVQTLDDAELAVLGRVHTAAQAREAASGAVAAGLDLSCDLMCGIPLQTRASWERSLAGVLETGACHVSCYPLILEEGTPLEAAVSRGELAEPDDDTEADLMLAAERVLSAAGFARYEVASYARPGKACAHNCAYWTGTPYLGLGAAASSMLTPADFAALVDAVPLVCAAERDETLSDALGLAESACAPLDGAALARRILAAGADVVARVRMRLSCDARGLVDAVAGGAPIPVEVETLTAREAAAEDLMLGMRMTRGVPAALERRAVSVGIERTRLEAVWSDLEASGLVRALPDGGHAPTQKGWLLGNELYGPLWALAEG